MCSRRLPCPTAARRDRDAARTVARHPEQGWGLVCMTTHPSPARTPSAQGQNEDPHRSLHTRTRARPGEPHVAVAAIQPLRKAGNEIDPAALRGLIKAMSS
jgi:Family of unknown function (DUF5999)